MPAAPTHLNSWSRAGLAILGAVFGMFAWGSGLDRIIAATPHVSPAVAAAAPGIFADASLRRAAAIELSGERYESAAELARAAVIRSPLEPTSTGLLGAALLGEGKSTAADEAFRVSGQLGWRDSITQNYWMQVALLTRDPAIAAQRLDAILRREPSWADQSVLLAPFESTIAGRAALADRLALNPGWTSTYLNPISEIGPGQLAQRAQVATLLANNRQVGCADISRFVRKLISGGAVRPAHDLWQLHCPEAGNQLIADPNFANGVRNDPSPFGWQKFADGSISIRGGGANGGLVLGNSAPFARDFIRQMLVLAPGNYRLSWQASEADGRPSQRIRASTGCTTDTRTPIVAKPLSENRMGAILRITGTCGGQYLSFQILPDSSGVNFGQIRLEAVTGTAR